MEGLTDMGQTIAVYCAEPTHQGRRTDVATLRRMYPGTADEFWSATHTDREGAIVRGLDKQTREDDRVSDDQLYEEVVEGGAAPSTLTLTLRCDHPRCGFDWQRQEPAVREVLNKLVDGGVSEIRLRRLAALTL